MRVLRKDRRAFTAIELIVVVIIIGILASAGMNKYKNFTTTARKNTCLSNQEQITSAIRLVENDSGPLTSNSVARLRSDGTIDNVPSSGGAGAYTLWVGTSPASWGVLNSGAGNTMVLAKAQEMKIFKCPEDANNLGPSYANISRFDGVASGDRLTYTFAKNVTAARVGPFVVPGATANPINSADPLEGYNWLRNTIEWQNTAFTFCRRWGLRDNTATGAAPIGTVAGDSQYIPAGQELRLAHSSYAPQN
ncbi:MAG: prepilin-type N-terminal cleavage/methylation domain-containing protein [Candidatus Wallbacteria bacterium]|nr:prepilin-type N-terminal cleavage/methylation domain-containing protein [Candidatus Wallbacteria bacterium]